MIQMIITRGPESPPGFFFLGVLSFHFDCASVFHLFQVIFLDLLLIIKSQSLSRSLSRRPWSCPISTLLLNEKVLAGGAVDRIREKKKERKEITFVFLCLEDKTVPPY